MDPKIINRLSDVSMWLRILLSVLFIVVNYFAQQLLILTGVIQTLWSFVTGKPNQHMHDFSKSLAQYAFHMTKYFNLLEEKKPFPFTAWPK